jgi:hypothetical protein
MEKEKMKKWITIIFFLAVILFSLFLAYENGVIGKAIIKGMS